MRDGKTICTLDAKKGEITEDKLIKNMVGREIENIYPSRNHKISDEIVLEVKNWTAYEKSSEKPVLDKLNELGWEIIEHGFGIPQDPSISYRTSFKELTLKSVFKEAVKNIEAIISVTDAIMVARGDLGVEMPMEQVGAEIILQLLFSSFFS